jgi:hypothetical protein
MKTKHLQPPAASSVGPAYRRRPSIYGRRQATITGNPKPLTLISNPNLNLTGVSPELEKKVEMVEMR